MLVKIQRVNEPESWSNIAIFELGGSRCLGTWSFDLLLLEYKWFAQPIQIKGWQLVTEAAVKRRVPKKNFDFSFSTNNTCHVFRIGGNVLTCCQEFFEVFSSGGCREGGEPLEGAGSTWASDLAKGA